MLKNNCKVGQKFNFSGLIILQFFLIYVGLWSYTQSILFIFQKRSINTFQVIEEVLRTVAVTQEYREQRKRSTPTYQEK